MPTIPPGDDDRPLRRQELADYLTSKGYRISAATLATLVTRGGGPPFSYWGRLPIYSPKDALTWAKARAGDPVTSTAEWRARNQPEAAA
jgi:hypothetical protein